MVSRVLVDHLKLGIEPHPHPYIIDWITKGPFIKVTDLCHVLISIDKFYQCIVTCDMVDMEACHIFWGYHGIMMLKLPTEVKRISICLIGRAEELS